MMICLGHLRPSVLIDKGLGSVCEVVYLDERAAGSF